MRFSKSAMSQIAIFDSSALIKRYVTVEAGSARVMAICDDDSITVTVSRLVRIEGMSAMSRRLLRGELTEDERDIGWQALTLDCASEYRVMPVDEPVAVRAERVVAEFGVRTLDAIHVATALLIASTLEDDDALTFYTADRRQAAAATAAGLTVEYLGEDG